MLIKYLGHACFKVTANDYSIILDPYKGVNGFDDINEQANEVICSHGHFDHCYVEGVKIIERNNSPFKIKKLSCFHDDAKGSLRGENTITILEAEGKRIAHFGDLGHDLDETLRKELSNLDAIMIPAGGHYTIGPKEAVKIIKDIKPKYIIPMHYKDGNKGLEVIKELDEFTSLIPELKDSILLLKGYYKEIEL